MSTERKDDGGPAFPQIETDADRHELHGEFSHVYSYGGMSLRDYFAGQALHEAAGAVCDDLSEKGETGAQEHAARHAKAAYLLADAMLAERQKERG